MSDVILVDPLPPVLSHSTLNLLAGASGVGKTSLIAYMAKCFLDGTPLFGYQPAKIPAVGYLGADRPWKGDTELWFKAYGIPDLPYYSLVEDAKFQTAKFSNAKPGVAAEIFEEHLLQMQLPPSSLLIVDPIALYIGGDQNHYTKVAMGCINLQRVIRKYGYCVIGVDHSSKQKGGDDSRYTRLQDRIGGSMAKLGYSATQMYLAGPEEMELPHHTFLWNPHHAKSQTFALKQDPETGLFTPIGGTVTPEKAEVLKLSEDELKFCAALPQEPFSSAAITQLFADLYSRATIFRYLRALQAAGLVEQIRHGLWQKTPGTSMELPTDEGSDEDVDTE